MTTRSRAALAALALLVAAGGCGTTRTSRVMTGTPSAPWTGYPAIVMENEAPPPDFDEVAIVQAVGHGTHADLPHVIAGLQDEAASLGCNVVVRVRIDQGSTMASGTGVAGRTRVPMKRTPVPQPDSD